MGQNRQGCGDTDSLKRIYVTAHLAKLRRNYLGMRCSRAANGLFVFDMPRLSVNIDLNRGSRGSVQLLFRHTTVSSH